MVLLLTLIAISSIFVVGEKAKATIPEYLVHIIDAYRRAVCKPGVSRVLIGRVRTAHSQRGGTHSGADYVD